MIIDVFNGDADGICALHQLRLAEPVDSQLVTGIKRDIDLLKWVKGQAGDQVTVLDISLDKNREPLVKLLEQGIKVLYIDHHYAGDIPEHHNLTTVIDTQPTVCTSLLVSTLLQNQYLPWAVTAAFGDNLYDSAVHTAETLDLSEQQLEKLKILGTCINYNGYGASLDDLFYHPADLYKRIKPYSDPFDFIEHDDAFLKLKTVYEDDLANAVRVKPESSTNDTAVFILPDTSWARRVSGIYGNDLARNNPGRAHAVLTQINENDYQVSVRAPLKTKTGADTLCRQFETGGGREAAAGINVLPGSEVERFINLFSLHYTS